MVEPFTVGGVGGALVARKVFGPAVDEVAEFLRRKTAHALGNVSAVTEVAAVKAGPETELGTSLRAAITIIDDASYADSAIAHEYFGGILASAKRRGEEDDQAVGWSALVARLSSDQMRMHYVVHACLHEHLQGNDSPDRLPELWKADLFIPFSVLVDGMGWSAEDVDVRFEDAFYGCFREDLFGFKHRGSAENLQKNHRRVFPEPGVVLASSRTGLGLWLWVNGRGGGSLGTALQPGTQAPLVSADVPVRVAAAAVVESLPSPGQPLEGPGDPSAAAIP